MSEDIGLFWVIAANANKYGGNIGNWLKFSFLDPDNDKWTTEIVPFIPEEYYGSEYIPKTLEDVTPVYIPGRTVTSTCPGPVPHLKSDLVRMLKKGYSIEKANPIVIRIQQEGVERPPLLAIERVPIDSEGLEDYYCSFIVEFITKNDIQSFLFPMYQVSVPDITIELKDLEELGYGKYKENQAFFPAIYISKKEEM